MSNWSSFKDEQCLMENWRFYLEEEEIEERVGGGQTYRGAAAGSEEEDEDDPDSPGFRFPDDTRRKKPESPIPVMKKGKSSEKGLPIPTKKSKPEPEAKKGAKPSPKPEPEAKKGAKPSPGTQPSKQSQEDPSPKDGSSEKQKRLGLKFTGEPRLGGTVGTLTPARPGQYQKPDLYLKRREKSDDLGAGAGTGAGAGADADDGTGDQKLPIPVFKKFTGKERETINMPRASAGSLSSQLMKLYPDIDKAIITQILKDIAGQLKTNNIQIQEAKKLFLEKLISEVRRDTKKGDDEKVAAYVRKEDIKPGEVKKVKKLKGVTGRSSFVAVNKKGVGRVYSSKDEAEEWSKSGKATTEDKLYDLFVKTIKRLDLHTQAGRKAAMENEQSYLGAFRFFKAMQLANRSLKRGNLEDDYKKIIRKVEPLNEEARYGARYGEGSGKGAGRDLKTWLGNMINIFKEDGLADSERGMSAIKAAKKQKFGKPDPGPRTKADIEREREAAKAAGAETSRRTGKSGVVNTRAVVGPRLKQGGIDLDSPEGRKLQKNMQKVIRRFLRKNLKRVGANPNLIAEQKFEDRLVELLVNYFSKV